MQEMFGLRYPEPVGVRVAGRRFSNVRGFTAGARNDVSARMNGHQRLAGSGQKDAPLGLGQFFPGQRGRTGPRMETSGQVFDESIELVVEPRVVFLRARVRLIHLGNSKWRRL